MRLELDKTREESKQRVAEIEEKLSVREAEMEGMRARESEKASERDAQLAHSVRTLELECDRLRAQNEQEVAKSRLASEQLERCRNELDISQKKVSISFDYKKSHFLDFSTNSLDS